MALVKYGEVTAPGGCLALVGYSNLKDWPTGFVSGGLNVLLESNGVICDARLRTREPDYQRRLTREECLLAAKMMRAMDPYDHSIPGHLLDSDRYGVSQALARLLLSDEMKPLQPRILMSGEVVRAESAPAEAPEHHWFGHSCSKCGARSTRSATEAGCPCVTYTLLDEDNTVLSVRASPGSQVTSGGVVLKCLVGGEARYLDVNSVRHDLSTPLFRGRRSGETYRVTEGELVRVWFEGATWRIDSYPQAEPTGRTVDEILRDPPRAVLDGYAQKRGRTWERFCRELAAMREAKVILDRIARVHQSVFFSVDDIKACVARATKE